MPYSEIDWIQDPANKADVNSKLVWGWELLGIEQEKEGDGEGNWVATHTKYIIGKKIDEE